MPKTNLKNWENKNSDDVIDDLELAIDEEADEDDEDEAGGGRTVSDDKQDQEGVLISKTKIALAKKLLENIKENNDKLMRLLSGSISDEDEARISIGQMSDESFSPLESREGEPGHGRIVEGV